MHVECCVLQSVGKLCATPHQIKQISRGRRILFLESLTLQLVGKLLAIPPDKQSGRLLLHEEVLSNRKVICIHLLVEPL
jgi:hypothetical protein